MNNDIRGRVEERAGVRLHVNDERGLGVMYNSGTVITDEFFNQTGIFYVTDFTITRLEEEGILFERCDSYKHQQ